MEFPGGLFGGNIHGLNVRILIWTSEKRSSNLISCLRSLDPYCEARKLHVRSMEASWREGLVKKIYVWEKYASLAFGNERPCLASFHRMVICNMMNWMFLLRPIIPRTTWGD